MSFFLFILKSCGGGLLFGLSFGWSSPAIPILHENGKFNFTTTDAAWSVAMLSLGSTFSLLPSGMIRNKFGTKLAIFLCAIPSLIGWILLIFPIHSSMIIVGRFLIGFTTGSYTFIVPVYIGEIASKQIRGTLLVIFDVLVKIGILTSYSLPIVLSLTLSNVIFLSIFIAYLITTLILPESPAFLIKKGKIVEAEISLRKLRAQNYNIKDEFDEFQQLENTPKSSFMKEMKIKATRKAFFIIICIFVLFQATGDNALLFYLTTIFIESGVTIDPYLSTIILGFVQLLAVGISIVLIDRRGRKFLLILSFGIMCVGLLGLAVFFNAKNWDVNLKNFQWVPIVCLCMFSIGFSAGLGSVPFVLVGELFTLSAKRIAAPLAQTTNFFLSFVVTLTFPIVAEFVGMFVLFYIFSLCCFIGVLYTWFVVPETKGKSLSEIQEKLNK